MRQSTTCRHPSRKPRILAVGGDVSYLTDFAEKMFSGAVEMAIEKTALVCMTKNVADIQKSADDIDITTLELIDDVLDRAGQGPGEG